MFQYAMGRSCSINANKKLYLDTLPVQKDYKRNFELDNYNVMYHQGPSKIILILYRFLWDYLRESRINKLINPIFKLGQEKQEFCYQDNSQYIYLEGYWQHVDFFKEHRNIILKDFKCKKELNDIQTKLGKKIQSENSVAIHLRRGDYLTPENQKIYAAITKNYYLNAIHYLEKIVGEELVLYFYSDDIEYCKQTFKELSNVTFIDSQISSNQIIDFELMRKSKYFILANSSFSWWASWLSERSGKIIISPEKWFLDDEINNKVIKGLLQNTIRIYN